MNHIRNGSFEELYDCVGLNLSKTKGWLSIDSISFGGFFFNTCNNLVPLNGNTFQFPRTGNSLALSTFYWSGTGRWYLKNRMKSNLHAGKTYCVKFHVNIANTSPRGMDGFGIYFGDNTIDTIMYNTIPLSYLSPQVKNPIGNVIKDTLNWVAVTGTFVANGNEKYALLGNFLADNAVTTSSIGGPAFPAYWTDVCIDDVSCIELNLPAYAGKDTTFLPGDSLFIGRKPDVGIDEACTWYKLPNAAPIATIAGFWVKPTTTCTYVVRQEICGLVKYDTVTFYLNGVGLQSQRLLSQNLEVYPNPANEMLNVKCLMINDNARFEMKIMNSFGQMIREEHVMFKEGKTKIDTKDLPNGVFILSFKTNKDLTGSKMFVITR